MSSPASDICADFLVEVGEILDQLGEQMVALERAPADRECLNAVFRGFHTIKGGAGFLDFPPMVAICHAVEDRLNAARSGEVHTVSWQAPAIAVTRTATQARQSNSVDLDKARLVVSVGRGIGSKENISLAEALCQTIGAELACSRPVAENEKWMEHERYVGISNLMLKPELYLAVGISGQIQHMVGANGAQTIFAINKDKNAPIFQYADFGIVGDALKILPALTAALAR